MPTYTPAFVRSPRFVTQAGTAGQDTSCKIYIHNDPDAQPSTPTYTLSKPIPSTLITSCAYDISPYLREYITHTSFTEITSDTAAPVGEYCKCAVEMYLDGLLQTTAYFIGFNGYGYFEDDYNANLTMVSSTPTFLEQGNYQVSDTGGCGGLFYHDDQVVTWEAKYTDLVTGGTTTITLANEVGYIPYLHSSYTTNGNSIQIIRNSVNKGYYEFTPVCEGKYSVIDCDFVNRYGHWQRLVFFKANKKSMSMENKEFNLMPPSINYDTSSNIRQSFNTNGKQMITCNTGWVDEEYSEVMKQLLFSEKILLDGKPVKLAQKNIDLMTHLNDKTINYEMKFEYANPMINNIQ
jgi:hypothetical protein